MKAKHIQILGMILSLIYGILIIWLYVSEPSSFGDVLTKATVAAGTYKIDNVKFDDGLRLFRAENYPAAREFFAQADPEKHDSNVQFYTAYSFYREGFGKVYNDSNLFKQGLETLKGVSADFKSNDQNLTLKTAAELRMEFDEGLKITSSDFNPLKILRERK